MSITLTPLSSYPLPASYLLTVDSAQILLDCGAFDSSPSDPSSSSLSPPSSSSSTQALSPAPAPDDISQYLTKLRDLAPQLNLVLLSHPLLTSLGLLPWLRARCGLRCPVYATLPTREMGRYAVEEWADLRSEAEGNEARELERVMKVGGKTAQTTGQTGTKPKKGKGRETETQEGGGAEMNEGEEVKMEDRDETDEGERDPWEQAWKLTTPEIRDAFLAINAVRWTQPIHLSGPLKGYTLTAHRSGHSLGGSLYTLRPSLSSSLSPASSASSLLYAPKFNHVKEHHLDPTALLSAGNVDDNFRRMGVVVVGAERSGVVNVKRIDRERKMLDLITSTLRSSGTVLLPTDPSARLFELLVLLETHWSFNNLGSQFPLCLVSKTGRDAVGFVRSLTEWMGGQLAAGEAGDKLKFPNLRIFPSLADLDSQLPPHLPKLIITVPSTLSHGPSRELFLSLSSQLNNLVLLTSRSEPGSLASWLAKEVWEREQGEMGYGKGKVGKEVRMQGSVSLQVKRKHYLAGAELEAHLAAVAEAAELVAKQQAALERNRRMMQPDAGESDSDSDASDNDEADGAAEEAEGAGGEEEEVMAPARKRRLGGFAGGAGAWDEFVDTAEGATGAVGGSKTQSFDIYVRGSYGLRVGGAGEGLPRFRMFPVVERRRRVDAYGEQVDVEGWMRRAAEGEEMEPENGGVLGKRSREEEEEEERKGEVEAEQPPEPPHRFITEKIVVELQAMLFVVDMEGLSDGRALKTILPQINPRKLVIVDGPQSAIKDLADACKAVTSMTEDLYTPSLGETVKVGEETKNFTLRLGDSVMKGLRLSRVEDYDVAFVSGVLQIDPESDLPVLERATITDASSLATTTEAEESATETTSTPPPADAEASADSTEEHTDPSVLPPLKPSLFIGDLRLALLKTRLGALNIPSEFTGEGLLICGPAPPEAFGFDFTAAAQRAGIDLRKGQKFVREQLMSEAMEAAGGRCAVRKVGRGRLVVEGSPGETYYVVRKEVYALHAQAG
ncbi:hypothetical protein JCM11641_006987 [Rhodosporidiobolus odoratus]